MVHRDNDRAQPLHSAVEIAFPGWNCPGWEFYAVVRRRKAGHAAVQPYTTTREELSAERLVEHQQLGIV